MQRQRWNGLVWFWGISTILGFLIPNPFLFVCLFGFYGGILIVLGYLMPNPYLFVWVLWHIKHFRIFNAKSIFVFWVYGISIIFCYLMPNRFLFVWDL